MLTLQRGKSAENPMQNLFADHFILQNVVTLWKCLFQICHYSSVFPIIQITAFLKDYDDLLNRL